MTPAPGSELLIVFAREPEPGRGKTRLASQAGKPFAFAVYQRLLARALRMARRVVRDRQDLARCELMIAGDWRGKSPDDAPFLKRFCSQAGARLVAQRGDELGMRMINAFADGFERGAARIVLMGCDCPTFTPADLHAAFDALETSELVIAPVADGGYSLIGLTSPAPHLFEAMHWSVDTVFSQTLARAREMRLTRLREQCDIDDLADWERWCAGRSARGLAESDSLALPSNR